MENGKTFEFLIASIGLILLLALSTAGSAAGLAKIGTSSAFYMSNPFITPRSYFAAGISFSIFLFALILSFLFSSNLNSELTTSGSFKILTASSIYGIVAYFVGNGIGDNAQVFFQTLNKNELFSVPFLLICSMYEVLVLFAMIISLIINKSVFSEK